MSSDIMINMGLNNNPYVIMPLKKTTDNGLTVQAVNSDNKTFSDLMNNFETIKDADKNKDNIISLKELENYNYKNDFAQNLLDMMITYNKNFIR